MGMESESSLENLEASSQAVFEFKRKFDDSFDLSKAMPGMRYENEKLKIDRVDQNEFEDSARANLETFQATADYELFTENTGLGFEIIESVVNTNPSPIHRDTATYQLIYKLQNLESLVDFLRSVEVSDLESNPHIKAVLESALSSFRDYMRYYSNIENPDAEEINLYVGMNQIVPECQRLGLIKPEDTQLVNYAHHLKGRTLKEYLQAEQQNLLPTQLSEFGPMIWVIDTSPEDFTGRWQSVLEVFRTLAKNPHGAVFAREMRDHLLSSIDNCRNILQGKDAVFNEFPDSYRAHFPSFQETLQQAESQLKMIEIVDAP